MSPKFNCRIIVFALFIIGIQFLSTQNLKAQGCPNADFSTGTFANWTGYTGSCCPILLPSTGIVAGQHTIMSGAGTDPNIGPSVLTVVAPGHTFSARLGNDLIGAQAEGLTYPMTVDLSNALFILKFAVVLQEPGHTPAQQPRFEIQVKDQFGNIIPCSEYLIASGGSIPGFNSYTVPGSIPADIRVWRDWTTLGIDLTPYIGQTVTIEARTGDCSLSGHFGYGYLVGECQPLEIAVQYCPGDTMAILTAPQGFQHYLWSSGDTTQSIAVNDPDSVNYTCTITSFNGCTASLNTVINPIVMEAGFTVAPPCESTLFTDTSVINYTSITQWDWDFGDGTSSTLQNPAHTFGSPGNYTVQLIASTTAGCSDTSIHNIVVEEDPTADFILPNNCGLNVVFTDSSFIPGHTIVGWNWTFGTGDTLATQNPNYVFPNDSTWPVQLIAYDERGCFDTLVVPFTNNPYPIADFNFQNLCEGNISGFLDSSYVNITTVNGWSWDFAGLGNSALQNPSFTFPGDGIYNITLIASTTGGCTDTTTQAVTVYPLPEPNFTTLAVCEGYTTSFTNTSTIPSDSISIYTWNFGSASVPGSNAANPTAVYPGDGVYTVTLITTSNQNCVDSISLPVTVWPNPEISFTGSPIEGCAPLTVDFDNGTTIPVGTVTGYNWTFEGGGSSTDTDPSNLFPVTPGTYDVTLYAISSQGCDTSITLANYITVHPDPSLDLGVDDSLCENATMVLDAGAGLTSYLWSTGATTSSITLNGGEGGTYWATVVNNFGCISSDTTFIKDLLLPIFNIDDMIICEGDTAYLFVPDTAVQTFLWSTASVPLFSIDNEVWITQAGDYALTVTNFCGSTVDTSHIEFVPDLQNLQMPNVLTVNGDGINDLYEIPELIDAIEFKLSIFDRWGVLLFESGDMNSIWDGTSMGTVVSQGTYFGVLSYINCQGVEKQINTAITVF